MAWISASVNPLAIRSMTVAARVPERKSCMALTIAARSSPASRGTGDVTRAEAGWQPEHETAPAGGSADTTVAAAIEASPTAAARNFNIRLHHRDAVVLQGERADTLAGRGGERVQNRRRRHADRRLTDPTPESSGRHDDRLDLGHLRDPHRVEVMEVRLLDATVLDRALLHEQRGQSVDERPGDLPFDLRRVDGVPGIGRADDSLDHHLVAAGDGDFSARRHIAA